MRMRYLSPAAVLALAACTEPPEPVAETRAAADYSTPIVLFVSPDSQEVDRLHRQLGDDDFYVVADDAMWYRAAAYELLDSMRIPHADVGRGAARFLVDGQSRLVSWKDVDRTWFLVVYDGKTEPRIAADIDVRAEVARLQGNHAPR